MAKIIINKQTTDNTGGVVSAGAFIGPTLIFPFGTMEIHYNLTTYRSVSDYEDGKAPIVLSDIISYGIVKKMTEEEYEDLTSNGIVAIQWLKQLLIDSGAFATEDLTIQS